MKTDEQRGPFAAWLRRERTARGWKEAETKRRLELAAAPGVSFSTYRDIEAGNRRPTVDQRAAITTVFGEPPVVGSGEATPSDLAALGPYIDVVNTLVMELRAEREENRTLIGILRELLPTVIRPGLEAEVGAEMDAQEAAAARSAESASSPRRPDHQPSEGGSTVGRSGGPQSAGAGSESRRP